MVVEGDEKKLHHRDFLKPWDEDMVAVVVYGDKLTVEKNKKEKRERMKGNIITIMMKKVVVM